MALEKLAGLNGAAFADNIFYYKIRNTAVAVGYYAQWYIAFNLPNLGTYKNITLKSVMDGNKESFIDVSDIVQAEVLAIQTTMPALSGWHFNSLEYNIGVLMPDGTYVIGSNIKVFWGQISLKLKQRPYISGYRSYLDLVIDNLNKGMPAQASNVSYMYRGGRKFFSFYFLGSQFFTHPSLDLVADYYKDGSIASTVVIASYLSSSFGAITAIVPCLYGELVDTSVDDWEKVEVYVRNHFTAVAVTNKITAYPKYIKLPSHTRQFIWRNSRGGYSSIQTIGSDVENTKRKGSSLMQSFGYIDHTQPSTSLLSYYDLQDNKEITTYNGYVMKAESEELAEILKNPFVWVREPDGTLNSIAVSATELITSDSETYNYNLKITWSYQLS